MFWKKKKNVTFGTPFVGGIDTNKLVIDNMSSEKDYKDITVMNTGLTPTEDKLENQEHKIFIE